MALIFYHVRLADRSHVRPTLDLTPGQDLSYWDARAVMLEFGHLFPQLHMAGSVSYLEIWPVRGDRP